MPASNGPRGPWALTIKAELERVAQSRKDADDTYNRPSMFRVPSYIKTLKPRMYDHQVLSFGLYNRDFENMTRMDEVRLEVVSYFLEQMKMMPGSSVDSWDDLCERVAGPPEGARNLRDLYDDGPDEKLVTFTTVRSVLTFDAVFLMVFLLFYNGDFDSMHSFARSHFVEFERIFHQKGVNRNLSVVYSDMWLFENQIPLSMIREVWNLICENNSDYRFNTHIRHTIYIALKTYSLPQAKIMFDYGISFVECNHLLHCLYVAVCHHSTPISAAQDTQSRQYAVPGPLCQQNPLSAVPSAFWRLTHLGWDCKWVKKMLRFRRQTRALTSQAHSLRSLPPITELLKAGIVVRGKRASVGDVRFVKSTVFKATLYLPQIDIDDNTETILRNLGAFEMIHSSNEHKLISYLSIMDDLINTEEDVRLLRKGKEPVIGVNFLGDDKDIAALFNALGQNVCFRMSREGVTLTKDVNDWCTQEKRQKIIRFVDRFSDRPWILVSLIAATLLLFMTGLQTIYSIITFYKG